ncbi:MAG TPA: hydrogenase 4 subunit F [Spirochaetota bacterium]|nr:hydrogenase 4 subunit F [Spirochaetota bacterium]HPF06659.1 hydrogenase 4 subunit F [Spirochaetota bacterium]HPJ41355.1 hydrogenase 4 subunit F [Spirochaetota bacterium]HRX47564.1 hydrogenase 4 subunit F [Spirochaetota bacterium]
MYGNINSAINLLLLIPLAASLLIWAAARWNNRSLLFAMHLIAAAATSLAGLNCVASVLHGEKYMILNDFLLFDSISGIFVLVISVVGLLINLYSVKYISWALESGEIAFSDARLFFSLSHVFIFTMILSVVSNNMILMWVAVEATTLSSVFLVSLYRNKRAIEGGWKYVIICSIGLAFALYGSVLMYSSAYHVIGDAHSAMLWTSLMEHAGSFDPDLMKVIFIFIIIGFGTKAGLAPMHTWLPDAHAEGPAPASAFLSAVLLKCAMAAILRYYTVMNRVPDLASFLHLVMIIVGLASVIIAALFIIRQNDIKRMFAYSSTENIGIIATALAFGGKVGIFAVFFHIINHSVTKALAFCTSGNLQEIYGTRDASKMGGLVRIAPVTAVVLGISIFSLAGMPPFAIFTSEFYTVAAGIQSHQYPAVALFLIGLAVVFYGLVKKFIQVTFGKPAGEVKHSSEVSIMANLPLIVLAAIICVIGIMPPDGLVSLINSAVSVVLNQ